MADGDAKSPPDNRAPCLWLDELDAMTRACLATARSVGDGDGVLRDDDDGSALLAYNRLYGLKATVAGETMHMVSVFRRPPVDDADFARRLPPDELVHAPYFGGVEDKETLEATPGLVDTTTMDWLQTLGADVGVVQLYYAGDGAALRSGVVALRLEFTVAPDQRAAVRERVLRDYGRLAARWRRIVRARTCGGKTAATT